MNLCRCLEKFMDAQVLHELIRMLCTAFEHPHSLLRSLLSFVFEGRHFGHENQMTDLNRR
jgi:hypothetical protein